MNSNFVCWPTLARVAASFAPLFIVAAAPLTQASAQGAPTPANRSETVSPEPATKTAAETSVVPAATEGTAAPSMAAQVNPPARSGLKGSLGKFVDRLELGVRPRYSKPLSAKTRSQFGEGGFSVRPTYFKLGEPTKRVVFRPDLSFSRFDKGENKVTTVGIGARYRRNFHVREPLNPESTEKDQVSGGKRCYPYYVVGLELMAGKVRVPSEGIDSNFKLGLGTSLSVGYQYKTRLAAEASLNLMTSLSSYNFSQFKIGLNYKL